MNYIDIRRLFLHGRFRAYRTDTLLANFNRSLARAYPSRREWSFAPLRCNRVAVTYALGTGSARGSTFLLKCCRKLLFMSSTESVSPHDVIVCACGTQEYTARDAIDAAIFRGELEEKWQTFLRHVAAEERADELELELDESAISAAAEEFRYRHDLITAEETEAWLANRGLTFDDFSDYFARQYCVGAVEEGFSPEQIEYTSAAPELRDLFVAELILSGALEDMTIKLMWRLAARCAGKEPTSEAIAAEERKFLHRIGIEPAQLAHWLEELGRDSQWLNEMLAIEAAYGAHCDRLLVPEARQRELMASAIAPDTI